MESGDLLEKDTIIQAKLSEAALHEPFKKMDLKMDLLQIQYMIVTMLWLILKS